MVSKTVTAKQFEKNMNNLGKSLEKFKDSKNMTYKDLGEKLECSRSYAKLLCTGQRKPESVTTLIKLEKKTGIRLLH